MANDESRHESPAAWAYGYEINTAHGAERLRTLRRLLLAENAKARRESRAWSCRAVVEERITHVLVVSDDLERDFAANARLEAALTTLEMKFSRMAPLAVSDESADAPPQPPAGGNDR